MKQDIQTATFAGGCFWCMEPPFAREEGVIKVAVGYAGGKEKNPAYEELCSGRTGHRESVQIAYDASKISYEKLLDIFWQQIDPTDELGQFADKGSQYKTAIFYHDEMQKQLAEKSKLDLEKMKKFEKLIMTEILPFTSFYPAEEHHQGYSRKNPIRYKAYRIGSGRDSYLKGKWGHK